MKEIYNFLKNLSINNNKEWFDANKEIYQSTRQKAMHLTEVLINEIRSFDNYIPYIEGKDCLYRIYRDVRFSNDKTPYKNYYGIYIARNGRKAIYPGYYLHILPGGSFLSGGVYMPQPEVLKAIRNEIYYHVDDYLKIVEDPAFKSTFSYFDEDKMKTNPKDFPKDFKHIDLLRYRSHAPFINISDEQLLSGNIIDFLIEKYRMIYPYNRFINEAIGNIE